MDLFRKANLILLLHENGRGTSAHNLSIFGLGIYEGILRLSQLQALGGTDRKKHVTTFNRVHFAVLTKLFCLSVHFKLEIKL